MLTGVGLLAMGTVANISGAVVAPGVVTSETRSKRVQHSDGGIIAKINVQDGTEVTEGDILIRLDDVQIRAKHAVIATQLMHLEKRGIRLRAERDRLSAPMFSPALDRDESEAIASERAQFAARFEGITRSKNMLQQQGAAKESENEAVAAELHAISDLSRIAGAQRTALKAVYQENHAKMLQLDREIAELTGRKGQRQAESARIMEQIAEIGLKLFQVETDFDRDVLKELAEVEEKARELIEKRDAVADKLSRIDIRAPQSGKVHELVVFTVGGVIRPSDTLMSIVPRNDKLVIEARVPPSDVDQLIVGQGAVVRFINFNRRTTPELLAKVVIVSADVAIDQSRQGAAPTTGLVPTMPNLPYYAVRLELLEGETKKLDGGNLVPGMQVQTFITTDERTVLSYLIKPITDRMQSAMRER